MPRRPVGAGLILACIVLAHLALALGYATVTPYRQGGRVSYARDPVPDIGAPDERQHVNYVRRLVEGRGLPVFDPKDPDLYENYQSHQPPLFYAVAAGWARLWDIDDFESRDAGLRLRSLNAVIGGLGTAGVFFLVLWSLKRVEAAAAAAVVAGLLPMNLALSGAVSNDPLLICLCAWTLAVAAKGHADGWNLTRAVATGVLCGLALLTKTTGLALLPALLLGFATWTNKRQWKLAAVALLLPVAVAGFWFWRNQQLYGDPLAMKAFVDAFQGSPKAETFISELGAFEYWTGINDAGLGVGWWTARSIVGVFGYMDIFLPKWFYPPILAAFGLMILARFFLATGADEPKTPMSRIMCATLFAVVVAFFVRFNSMYFQAQARYVMPALAPIASTLGIGLSRLAGQRPWLGIAVYALCMAVLNVYVLGTLSDEFERRVL